MRNSISDAGDFVYGKILGAIVGLIVGLAAQSMAAALALAIVGLLVGHRFDRRSDHDERPRDDAGVSLPEPQTAHDIEREARARFARHLCELFVEVARADGQLVREEVRVVRSFFENELGFDADELDLVRVHLKAASAAHVDLERVARECRDGLEPSERLLLVNALYELSLADGPLKRAERERIGDIAQRLELSAEDLRSIAALHLGEAARHYEKLGLSADATDDEVKRAYRHLASLHHPDKVAHLGAGAVELASRRFCEIKEAYDAILRLRSS